MSMHTWVTTFSKSNTKIRVCAMLMKPREGEKKKSYNLPPSCLGALILNDVLPPKVASSSSRRGSRDPSVYPTYPSVDTVEASRL